MPLTIVTSPGGALGSSTISQLATKNTNTTFNDPSMGRSWRLYFHNNEKYYYCFYSKSRISGRLLGFPVDDIRKKTVEGRAEDVGLGFTLRSAEFGLQESEAPGHSRVPNFYNGNKAINILCHRGTGEISGSLAPTTLGLGVVAAEILCCRENCGLEKVTETP